MTLITLRYTSSAKVDQMSYSYSPQFFLLGSRMLSFFGFREALEMMREEKRPIDGFLHGWTWGNGK